MVPLRVLASEAAEDLFHLDTKSLRTLRALALRPGFLTAEFLRGRRNRYVSPIRLYALLSCAFFLLLGLAPRSPADRSDGGGWTINYRGITTSDLRGLEDSEVPALMARRGMAPTAANRYLVAQMARVARGGQAQVRELALKSISYMVFVLMPGFGLLVHLLHRKDQPFYVGSLVFSLHYHAFAFLTLIGLSAVSWIPGLELSIICTPLLMVAYLPAALRRVYGTSWRRSLGAAVGLSVLHAASAAVLLAATIVVKILLV